MTTIEDINIGQTATFGKTISESDIYQFAGITGDLNPIHVDAQYAANTRFGQRIAHGMLSASFICTVLGTKLPGIGTIHLSQSLEFKKPVFIGDTINVLLTVIEVNREKNIVRIDCIIINHRGETVVKGIAQVKAPVKFN